MNNIATNKNIVDTDLIKSNKKINNKTKIINQYFYIIIKRIFDILGGIVGIIILIPMTIAIYIVRKILKEDDGPIFYCQLRIGKKGKYFKLYKYRTMVVGADDILDKYLKENKDAREEYKKFKKLKNDPRITKIGKFLRKTSMDEFPQLINVLKGDMSLVGPRPYLVKEKDDMNGYFEIITSVKPGITGYWQISGRSKSTFLDRLKKEKNYVENKSLWLDLKIILKTFIKVIRKEGAL